MSNKSAGLVCSILEAVGNIADLLKSMGESTMSRYNSFHETIWSECSTAEIDFPAGIIA